MTTHEVARQCFIFTHPTCSLPDEHQRLKVVAGEGPCGVSCVVSALRMASSVCLVSTRYMTELACIGLTQRGQ